MKIKYININGARIPLTNLNIIVGPNGVGKTTLLKDLHSEFIGEDASTNSSPVKWMGILEEDSFEASLSDWKEWRDSLRVVTGESYNNIGRFYADPKSMGRSDNPRRIKDIAIAELDQEISNSNGNQVNFNHEYHYNNFTENIMMPFKDQRSVFMTVDNRFYLSSNNTGNYDIDAGGGIQPAPFLADNDDILKSINAKMTKLFGKKIFVESRKLPTFSLFVGRSEAGYPSRYANSPKNLRKITEAFDEWIGNNNIINLQDEGHGVRAAAQVLYELENTANKIVFIDEPEIHLYPSAKYTLGQYIGEYAKQGKKQVIVTTHDTDMLGGLIDASSRATVIRIDSDRAVRHTQDSEIQKTIPSFVLQSAFLDAVIVTEGLGDAYVYRGAIYNNKLLQDTSYSVISMEGKNKVAHSFYFFERLGIRYAAIYDFDVLFCINTIKECLGSKVISESTKRELLGKVTEINAFMKSKKNKKKGIKCPGLSVSQKHKISDCLNNFASEGIFICPIGELEDWVNVNKRMGKEEASPEAIFRKYKSRSRSTYKELTDFVTDIAKYIERTEQ